MAADLWQHRVNNDDWGDGWWWTDDRLALLNAPDETFLRFLAEMVHPVVRPIPNDDDLPALVKLTVKSVPVVPTEINDPARWNETIVRLVNNLSSLGRSLAELRNAFGTGHGQAAGHIGLDARHARLAVRMATAVGVFLYEVHERNPAAG